MTAAHHRLRPAVLAVLTLFFLLLPAVRSYAAEPPEVLRAVHTDALHTTYDGTSLALSTRIGLGEYRVADPSGLIFNLEDKGAARVELPDLPAFAFLGKPGDSVWIAPESQDPELIWPGWDTETIAPGALAGDSVDLTLLSSSGPGNVEVFFNYDEFTGAAQRLFSAADPALRVLHQPVGRHVHANWAFTQLGTYHLTFQATATTAAGVPVSSGPVVYTFVVGPYEPSTPTTPPTTPPGTPPGTPPTTSPGTPPATPPTTPPGTPPTTPPGTPPTTPPGTPPSTRPTSPPGKTPTTRPTQPPSATPTQVAPRPTSTHSSVGGASSPSTGDRSKDQSSKLPPCVVTSAPSGGGTNGPGSTNSPGGTNSGGGNFPGGTNSPGSSPGGGNSPGNTPGGPGGDQTRTTLSNGHADYAVRLEGGKLASRVKDGTKPGTPVWRDPAKVTIQLTAASQTRAPGGAFAFLGPAGATLWQIPQTQKDGVVWLGWNTEELSSSQLSTGVDWRLDRVTGPGNLAVFEFDSFGRPKIIFNSGDGVPDTYRIPLGTHAHGNWSFTKSGTYQATFTHKATLTTGATSTTTSTLTFAVSTPTTNAHTSAYTTTAGADAQSAVALGTGRTSAGDFVHELSKSRAENAQVVHKVAGGAGASAGGAGASAGVGCKLAATGGSVGVGWVAGGAVLVVAGVVVLVAARRRRGVA